MTRIFGRHCPLVKERARKQLLKVTWTQGHASQEHIDKGLSTVIENERNKAADEWADQCQTKHIHNHEEWVEFKAAKQRQIAILIQTVMVKVWKARREPLASKEAAAAAEDEELRAQLDLERELKENSVDNVVSGALGATSAVDPGQGPDPWGVYRTLINGMEAPSCQAADYPADPR